MDEYLYQGHKITQKVWFFPFKELQTNTRKLQTYKRTQLKLEPTHSGEEYQLLLGISIAMHINKILFSFKQGMYLTETHTQKKMPREHCGEFSLSCSPCLLFHAPVYKFLSLSLASLWHCLLHLYSTCVVPCSLWLYCCAGEVSACLQVSLAPLGPSSD